MDTILYIIAGPLFIISLAGLIYVQLRLRPKPGSQWEDVYYEFEDQHREIYRYNKWYRITFAGLALSVLLAFMAIVV